MSHVGRLLVQVEHVFPLDGRRLHLRQSRRFAALEDGVDLGLELPLGFPPHHSLAARLTSNYATSNAKKLLPIMNRRRGLVCLSAVG